MPRPILYSNNKNVVVNSALNTRQAYKADTKHIDKQDLERLLRKQRSPEYMNAMKSLDAGGRVHNKGKVDAIIKAIQDEFPEVQLQDVMLGIVSKCYLGAPYEVHTLDMTGSIIRHYERGELLAGRLELARGIAMYGGYDFIEVYHNYCCAVDVNGNTSIINF